jgi:hypothetical protein
MTDENVRIRTNEEIAEEIKNKPDLYQFFEDLLVLEKNSEAEGSNRPEVQRWNLCYLLDHYHDER